MGECSEVLLAQVCAGGSRTVEGNGKTRKEMARKEREHRAATKLQASWRGHYARSPFNLLQSAAGF